MAGAGVRPGLVLGATDRQGAYATRRPVSPGDVAATVYDALGIDPHKALVTPDGRPVEVLATQSAVDAFLMGQSFSIPEHRM